MVTITTIQQQLATTSAEAVIKEALEKAKNDTHNTFISLTAQRALDRARQVDSGEITGSLAGVPFAIKDNFLAYGGPTTAASNMLERFDAPLQATAVKKLEAEGAICIGKVNLDAFAHGASTETSVFGATLNAVDATRVAGGSSGGSAVVVARDIVPFALGTDTGGSIRQPASFNGVVGFKPTYGAVSRYGVVAMASGSDTVGVLANTVDDTAQLMSILAGRDPRDMTTLPDFFAPAASVVGKKLGVIKEFLGDGVDQDVRARVLEAAEQYRSLGYEVEEVSLPLLQYAIAIYYIVVPAEISSNLSRYDGVRFGAQHGEGGSLSELYGRSRQEGFTRENKRRIIIGNYVLSSGFFDAYYQKAQKARTLLAQEFSSALGTYDALIGPVAPSAAFELGELGDDPLEMYLRDTMTVPASLLGLPAASVPVGATEQGLPIGLQIIGSRQQDAQVLAVARDIEGAYGR